MAANKKLLILPGDGIGPEVMREVRRVIDWMDRRRMVTFDVSDDHVGGSAIDTYGTPMTDETMQKAKDADGMDWAFSSGRRSRSCGCARNSTCSRTCVPPSCWIRWWMRRR
jgi:3-isopropylmalate dehydrogenase